MRRMFSEKQLENQSIELLASGQVPSVKADEIIENMEGYSFTLASPTGYTIEKVYVGAVKNGNKLTLVLAFNITRTADELTGNVSLGQFVIPSVVGSKLYHAQVGTYNYLVNQIAVMWATAWTNKNQIFAVQKADNEHLNAYFDSSANTNLNKDTKYYCRIEMTFLLSESL